MTFMTDCLKGDASVNDVDDYIEKWHSGEEGQELDLHEYLGMSWEEYSAWLTKPSILQSIVDKRKNDAGNHH